MRLGAHCGHALTPLDLEGCTHAALIKPIYVPLARLSIGLASKLVAPIVLAAMGGGKIRGAIEVDERQRAGLLDSNRPGVRAGGTHRHTGGRTPWFRLPWHGSALELELGVREVCVGFSVKRR